MVLKYKCIVETEMPIPNIGDKDRRQLEEAIDQLIDSEIYNAVFDSVCDEDCKLKVTRELLEIVEGGESEATTSCGKNENETQDIVSE